MKNSLGLIGIAVFISIFIFSSCSTGLKNNESTLNGVLNPKDARLEVRDLSHRLFTKSFSETEAVDVLYVTNRELDERTHFSVNIDRDIHYGLAKVNVPKKHKVGQFELTDNPREDTHQYFRFLSNQVFTENSFFDEIKADKQWGVLVFVHGFNVPFDEAVTRAAQIAYDLKFQGKIILWSWPAGSGEGFFEKKFMNKTYETNRNNAEYSVSLVADFMKKIAALEIPTHLLVHSMGHQVAIPALVRASNEISKPFIDEVILNAPDISVEQFQQSLTSLKKLSNRVTLYCSYNDHAMVASQKLNGGIRMGACSHLDGVDVINVGEIDDPGLTGLGHGYYASRDILADVFQVLLGLSAEKRLFIRKSEPNSTENFILRK